MTRMPFGKLKGQLIAELDDQYVLWLLTLDDLKDPLLSAVGLEADRRMGKIKPALNVQAPVDDRAVTT